MDPIRLGVEQHYFSVYNQSTASTLNQSTLTVSGEEAHTWKVPLFIDGRVEWLGERRGSISHLSTDSPLIDSQVRGYYRVLYTLDQYRAIRHLLLTNHTAVPVAQRARLIEDAFTFARKGLLGFGTAFEMCEYLVEEREYMPLLVFNNHLQLFYLMMRNRVGIELTRVSCGCNVGRWKFQISTFLKLEGNDGSDLRNPFSIASVPRSALLVLDTTLSFKYIVSTDPPNNTSALGAARDPAGVQHVPALLLELSRLRLPGQTALRPTPRQMSPYHYRRWQQ